MKIKKIKSQGEFVYPATIAAAVKDANFLKEDDSPMTLGEVNLYLNSEVSKTVKYTALILNDDLKEIACSNIDAVTGTRYKYAEELIVELLTPQWLPDHVYGVGEQCRMGGFLFKSKVDYNQTSPYQVITDSNNNIIYNNKGVIMIDNSIYNSAKWTKVREIDDSLSVALRIEVLESQLLEYSSALLEAKLTILQQQQLIANIMSLTDKAIITS